MGLGASNRKTARLRRPSRYCAVPGRMGWMGWIVGGWDALTHSVTAAQAQQHSLTPC